MPNPQLIEPGPFNEAAQAPGGEVGAPEAQAPAAPSLAPPAGEAPAPQAGEAPAAPQAPIYKGIQREFTSIEDLSKYTLELERQTLEQQARLAGMGSVQLSGEAPQLPQKADPIDYAKLGEALIINPKNAVEQIISHVRSSVLGDVNQHVGRQQFFESFYDANPDLAGCEDLVEASVRKNEQAWSKVPTEQAAKLLAHDVRSRAEKIRGVALPGTTLSSRPSHALPSGAGASRGSAPAAAAPAAKVLSMSEQLKAHQAKRRIRA